MTLAHPADAREQNPKRGAFYHRFPGRLSAQELVLLACWAGRSSMTTLSGVSRYSSNAFRTAVSATAAVVEAAKTLSGPVGPPPPSMVHGKTTYFPISSLRRDKYDVVFLMEGGDEVLGFKLTRRQPQRMQSNGSVGRYEFERVVYFVRCEDGGTSELPRSAWPVAWRPQAYAE
jgi:hypothetical protein